MEKTELKLGDVIVHTSNPSVLCTVAELCTGGVVVMCQRLGRGQFCTPVDFIENKELRYCVKANVPN